MSIFSHKHKEIEDLRSELIKLAQNQALMTSRIDALETNISSLRNAVNRRGRKIEEELETQGLNSLIPFNPNELIK